MLKKKNIFLLVSVFIMVLFFIKLGIKNNVNLQVAQAKTTNVTKLPIPPLVEGDFTLIPQNGEVEFFEGIKTKTRGYNGNLLGPTLKFKKGNEYNIDIKNEMEEETTVHWHGLLVDSDVDGVFQVVEPNETYSKKLKINQEASTAWYHPHTMHKTASQVMDGLAGFIIIEDEESKSLNLPSEYGVNDIPVVFQSKGFNRSGQIGLNNDRFLSLVNGVNSPTLEVKNEWVRLRIINGNNDELFKLKFSNNVPSYIIGTDNGLIEKPIEEKELLLSPGERVELLLDLTDFNLNDVIKVYTDDYIAMDIKITEKVAGDYDFTLPSKLVDFEEEKIDYSTLEKRNFYLSMRGMRPSINGKLYKENYINEEIKLGSKEIWTITNDRMMMSTPHPFHVHGVTFKVLDRNGKEIENWEKGYKDTVLLFPGETVTLLVSFENEGKFVYHCHFLDHEEDGMMGNFTVY